MSYGKCYGCGSIIDPFYQCPECQRRKELKWAADRNERQRREEFKKLTEQNERLIRAAQNGSDRSYSSSSQSSQSSDSSASVIFSILMLIVLTIVVFAFSGNSSSKNYSFYTPNNVSLKQSLKPGVVYNQYQCDKHSGLTDDPSSCVEIPKNDFERFCNEFDGINTVDNKEILDWKTGEITSLSREVDRRFDNPYCRIEFTMILDGKVKTGAANVITWTVNAEGKLVPYSSYGSTRWK